MLPGQSRRDIARIFKVQQPTVSEWANKGTVPWSKLKYLSDSQAVSYDWLIDGIGPKQRSKEPRLPRSVSPKFSRPKINRRYLSLFTGMSFSEIAQSLGTPAVVHIWHNNASTVSWQRLHDAVQGFGVRWDWLLDGLEPKYRETSRQ